MYIYTKVLCVAFDRSPMISNTDHLDFSDAYKKRSLVA